MGRGTEGDRATRCLSKTKPRERETETECEKEERAPSLRRERGTRGDPRSQRQFKSAVKGREETAEQGGETAKEKTRAVDSRHLLSTTQCKVV